MNAEAVGFWFAAVVLLVAAAAAGAGRRYLVSGAAGLLGFCSILVALSVLPVAHGGEAAAFWICSLVAVPAAVTMVVARKAVHSALCLAVVMVSLAVLYAAQDAPFLAFVQIIVYTGAVLMLFLFVLMLVGVDSSDALVETIRGQRVATAVLGLGFLLLLLAGMGTGLSAASAGALTRANSNGNVFGIGQLIYTRYVFAFEVTGALLITAALAAMVLAHREVRGKVSQKVLQRRRIAGPQPSPLSPPGVYARHNAVDVPALLPDGTPADASVNQLFRGRPARRPGELPAEPATEAAGVRTVAPPEAYEHLDQEEAAAEVRSESALGAGDPGAETARTPDEVLRPRGDGDDTTHPDQPGGKRAGDGGTA